VAEAGLSPFASPSSSGSGTVPLRPLRLQDGRLLYTYTQRALDPPLGVRALVGTEQKDGFTFDFNADRLCC